MIVIKRIGYLITEDNITIDFCIEVIQDAAFRKTKRENVQRVLDNIDEYAEKLRNIVLQGTFEPSPYSYEIRYEHGKERKLQKPRFFPDQALHHLLIKLLRPKIDKRLDPYAVASIPKRGQALGIKKLKYWIQQAPHARRDSKYFGKGDIKQCFASVKPDVIMRLYSRMIKDKKYLSLITKVVYSSDSLPLGNYMSAWTLNLLLKDMDEAIRKHPAVKYYLRYMDDFIFLSSNKKKARNVISVIKQELAKLGLELKFDFQIHSVDSRGIDMIGYRFFRNYIILRKRNYKHILTKVNKMSKNMFYKVHDCQSIMAMLGQCRHCNSDYIWKVVGHIIDIYKVKKIIGDNSRLHSYLMSGREYIPTYILI